MFRHLLALTLVASTWGDEVVDQRPIYKVQVQSEDLSAAGSIPLGFQGGYLPIGIGGGGIGGGGIGIGGSGFGGGDRFIGQGIGGAGGFYPGLVGAGGIGLGGAGIGLGGGGGGGFIGGGGIGIGGGEYIDKSAYSGGKKNANDLHYEKADGKKGAEFEHGQGGHHQGKTAIKNVKGDHGYYAGEEGGKKLLEDEKKYHGGKAFNQEGKNALEKKIKQGHKKGHVIKGFKSSHSKDETGKTEEFYDEEKDEGLNFNFQGQQGNFGENAQSAYKGAKEDLEHKADKNKKEGHYGSEHLVDKNDAGHGQYGTKKFEESGQIYGINNGVDQHSLLGHQENSKYFKHYPHHVPIFG